MVRNTYGKAERLKSRKSIDQLFKEGQRFNMGVVRDFRELYQCMEKALLKIKENLR